MSDIFGSADSVFFVGGQGTKTGTINPGGCSRMWWETAIAGCTKAEIQAAMNKIMGINGEAKWNLSDCDFDYLSTQFTVPDSSGMEVGMVAYLSGTDIIPGRYRLYRHRQACRYCGHRPGRSGSSNISLRPS